MRQLFLFTALAATAAASPTLFAQAAPPADAAPVACSEIESVVERAEQARRKAQDDSDNAWKAVVPFVVLARKAGAHAALDEADKQLVALKARRAECFPFS